MNPVETKIGENEPHGHLNYGGKTAQESQGRSSIVMPLVRRAFHISPENPVISNARKFKEKSFCRFAEWPG